MTIALRKGAILFVALIGVFFGLSTNVSAMENNDFVGVSPIPPTANGNVSTYGTSKPSNVWSWSKGAYSMSGSTANTNLYTNYVFTVTAKSTVKSTKANENIKMELYKVGLIDSKFETITVSRLTADDLANGKTRTVNFVGLNSGSKYYIKILAPAHFSAKISN